MKYTFVIDEKKYEVHGEDYGKAMVKMNREIVDKNYSYIKHFAWFGHDDDSRIPKNTWNLVRGNFFD